MARTDLLTLANWMQIAEKAAYSSVKLSKEFRMSRRQLERWTKKEFGRSPHDWLQEIRFHKAATILLDGQPVKSVAFQLGFKQVSHFSREFRRHHGISPKQYLLWKKQEQVKIFSSQIPKVI